MYPLDDKHGRHRYKGNWASNKKNGHGVMEWTSGQTYEGNWENGLRSGIGTQTWPEGARYTGSWHRDMRFVCSLDHTHTHTHSLSLSVVSHCLRVCTCFLTVSPCEQEWQGHVSMG
jgi:MORN repeat